MMDGGAFSLVLGEVFLGIACVVVVATTWAAASGRMARNGGIGIRTPNTAASDAAWQAGHRAALPWAVSVCGLALMAQTALLVAWGCGWHGAADGPVPFAGDAVLVVGLLATATIADRAAGAAG